MNYGGGGLIETSGENWLLSHFIQERLKGIDSPIVFDVGANVGDYSLSVARHLAAARILAFEPADEVYAELARQVSKTNSNVETFKLGFSDTDGSETLHLYAIDGHGESQLSSVVKRLPTQVAEIHVAATQQISVRTVDSFCEQENIDKIDLLKLDVEGHELAVLKGAQRMLREGRISLIQFEFGPANIYSRSYFYDFWLLLSERYDIFRLVPFGLVPITYYGEHREIFLTTNYLAIIKP